MKKTLSYFMSAVAFSLLVSSCKKDDHRKENQQRADEISAIVQGGTWKITTLKDDGIDRTDLVRDYTFTFDSNNKLIAVLAATSVEGTWSVTADDDRNDVDFNIFFSNPVALRELNEDWDVLNSSANLITLSDDDDNPDDDILIFEKQ